MEQRAFHSFDKKNYRGQLCKGKYKKVLWKIERSFIDAKLFKFLT